MLSKTSATLNDVHILDVMVAISHVGDGLFALSMVLLLYRLYTVQPSGISVKTQIFHFLLLLARYLDIFQGIFVSSFNTALKVFFLAAQTALVAVLIEKTLSRSTFTIRDVARTFGCYILPTVTLSLVFHYLPTFLECAWAFSHYLFAIAEIPQLLELYHSERRDAWLVLYVTLIAFWKIMYLPKWIFMYVSWGHTDPIAQWSSAAHIMIWAIFMLLLAFAKPSGRVQLSGQEEEADVVL